MTDRRSPLFRTEDGHTLYRLPGGDWTDGDLTFADDPDRPGWPVNEYGVRLDGCFTDEEPDR
jgi:hypothetical protein